MYTASYTRQLYFLFLICLSLFSSAISHCIVTSSVLLTFQYTVFCSILFSLHFLLHNLSWYQSFSGKPFHIGWRATRSSQRRAYTDHESMRHRLFTRLGELFVILSKDPHRKLTRGRRELYAQKIEQVETAEGETLNNREQFHIRQRFTKKSCRRQEHLKNSKKFV